MSAWTVIAHTEVGSGGVADITFMSVGDIPSTYTDLFLSLSLRNTGTSNPISRIQLNGNTSSVYSSRLLYGTGSGSGATYAETTTKAYIGDHPASNWTASTFGSIGVYFPNYRSSSNKSFSVDAVAEQNATTSWQQISAHLWSVADPITSIKIFADAGNLAQYSSATLYGITKGSSGGVTVS